MIFSVYNKGAENRKVRMYMPHPSGFLGRTTELQIWICASIPITLSIAVKFFLATTDLKVIFR